MTTDAKSPESLSFKRWSRRKLEAARESPVAAPAVAPVATASPASAPVSAATAEPAPVASSADALPPVGSLTIDSDFTVFLKPRVDEALKRQALKQLFRDPRFNVMDGLDVYIDDYSIPDPISPELVRQLVQGRYIFDPPQTRVNALGHAEDVPPEEIAAERAADPVEADVETGPLPAVADANAPDSPAAPETAGNPPVPTDSRTTEPGAR